MLNRKNRTLSANSNRLNLGTRSFVLEANVTNGKSTLRARSMHGRSPRVGMQGSHDPRRIIHPTGVDVLGIPSSTRVVDVWPVSGPRPVAVVVEPASPCPVEPRFAERIGQARPPWRVQGQSQPKPLAKSLASSARYASPRLASGTDVGTGTFGRTGLGRGLAQVRATSPVAAIVAAAGG